MKQCYIASGWFSPEWLQEVEDIKAVLDKHSLSYFSPKDDNLCTVDANESFQDKVFDGNINAMDESDWMICNTRNKDMGSIFEAGYFHSSNKPIIYFCAGLPEGAQFNLMLAASGKKVCTSIEDLDNYIGEVLYKGHFFEERYDGLIE